MSGEPDLVEALVVSITPRMRQVAREEVARAGLEWRWRTPEQAGELLGISAEAVRQRVLRGQLPGYRLGGRVYLDIKDLDALIGNGRYHGPRLQNGRATASTAPGPDDQGGTP